MNILEIEDLIKGLPDQALMQEAQQPSGRMPQYLVVSEIQRRGDMRKRFQAQQQEKGTVAEQILQGGVQESPAPQMQAPMGQPPAMMPPMGAQRPPMAPPAMMPPRPPMTAPQGIAALPQARGIPAPQAAQMAAQAPVRMFEGRVAPGSDPTLGQRLNNPFNLKDIGNQGFVGATGSESGFLRFNDPLAGIRAADRTLNTYGQKYGINTLAALLNRFAPSDENPTDDYIAYVSEESGFAPDQEIDLTDPLVRELILPAMGTFESRSNVTQDMIRRAREFGLPVAVERPTLMSELAPSALPSEDPGRGTGSQFTALSMLKGTPFENRAVVGGQLKKMLGDLDVRYPSIGSYDYLSPERRQEFQSADNLRRNLQYLYASRDPQTVEARTQEVAARFGRFDLPEEDVVTDVKETGAVTTDANRVVAGGPEDVFKLDAGPSQGPLIPGVTRVTEDLLDVALREASAGTKVIEDQNRPRLGGDPTGSYNLGDVSGIGSVAAAQQLLTNTPKVQVERDEKGNAIGLGEDVLPLQVELANKLRAIKQPGRSYQELIEKVMERSGRDYSEATAAAAALRAESEAEQQRLKEEGRSAALSDALVALGAGIAGGDLSGGLARAGQAATAARKEFDTAARQERRYGTLEARAEERAARAARSAAEAQEIGLMGRQVEADYEADLAKINRDLEADKVLATAAERLGADRRAAEQFLVTTRAKAESLMAQLARLDQEDRKQAELSARAIAKFFQEIATADLPAGMQMKSGEEQTRYRRQIIRQYIPDLQAAFGREIPVPDIGDAPIAAGGARPDLSRFDLPEE